MNNQINQDLDHLKWLSIGFYVYAGLTALFACLPVIHLVIGISMISGAFNEGVNPPPPVFGWFFVGIASIFILGGWALAVAFFLAGRFISGQRNYTFIFVMAVICCMFAPIGTVLGVFTIIVLLRDSVKALFHGARNYQPYGSVPPDWK